MGNELNCGTCGDCKSTAGDMRVDNVGFHKYSFRGMSRLSQVEVDDRIAALERNWLEDRDNGLARKHKLKPAVLREPESIADLQKAARAARFEKEEGMLSRYGNLLVSMVPDARGDIMPGERRVQQVYVSGVGEYFGEVVADKPEGRGKMTYSNNDVYEGDFVGGRREGYGVLVTYTGEKYQGQWAEDIKHGMGAYFEADGSVYEGEFLGGMREGPGKYTLPDGTTFVGVFASNMFFRGRLKFADGREYDGDWKDGLMHGKGTFRETDGSIYTGAFYKGKKHGNGEMTYADGRTYRGVWKADKREGKGSMIAIDGSEQSGVWADDKLVASG